MEVSKHIKKEALKVRLFGAVRIIDINGVPHKALKAYTGESKEYIVSVIRGQYSWSSCNCAGYWYVNTCKHIYVANQYLDKLEKEEKTKS